VNGPQCVLISFWELPCSCRPTSTFCLGPDLQTSTRLREYGRLSAGGKRARQALCCAFYHGPREGLASPDSPKHGTVYLRRQPYPGHELHKTPGNRVLRRVFDLLHASPPRRELVSPFFVFEKYPTQKSARRSSSKVFLFQVIRVFRQSKTWSRYGKRLEGSVFKIIAQYLPSLT
jgi:hypothetical protein